MKELKVNAIMYLDVEDDATLDEAVDSLLLQIDPNVCVYCIDKSFQNENGEEIV